GNLGITELLLDFGADMHAVGMLTSMECGQSPLRIACRKGEVGIARLLISRGAAVDMPLEFGPSALRSAAQTGNLEITTLLLENGADVNAQFGYSGCALECAIRARATDVVELLLKRGANANGHWKGKTPLQSAVMIDDEPMVKRLLQLGAD
ncbi:ankyrin repeat protein, partial [Cadophora sp. DSE1049]